MSAPQLTLGLRWASEFGREAWADSLQPGAVQALEGWIDAAAPGLLALIGPAGTGKSHLLRIAAERAAAAGRSVDLLAPPGPGVGVALLAERSAELVCLDGLDGFPAGAEWDAAWFHLLNRQHDRRGQVLIAARGWPPVCALPDLRSRWALAARWPLSLPIEGYPALVAAKARGLGLSLTASALAVLAAEGPRDANQLVELLRQLDRESLAVGGKPGPRLVRALLRRLHSSHAPLDPA
jgi:DnaA family protein